MEYNKTWITWFNKNKTKNLYDKVLKDILPDHKRCRICDGPIYYYDSAFSINKSNIILPIKKSYLSIKNVYNKDYYLSICEDCLTEKFPEYQEKNKSRVFNQMNNMTEYAFNIPKNISKKFKNDNYRVTKKNLIAKYGEEDGIKRWNSYKNKQSYTNTFDYKKKKYNWSLDDFDEYNKSRSVTLKNLIDRYGEENGIKMWDEYINKQKETKSKEYVINKYGYDYWKELCKSKRVTLDHYIKKYGSEIGKELYLNRVTKNTYLPSKESGEFFDKIDLILSRKYKTYYYKKDGSEFGKLLSNGRYVFLDYYILDLKICIEYYGSVWHANPKIFKFDDVPFSFKGSNKTSKEIWEEDKERIKLLKKDFDIDTIVVWEDDKSIQKVLKKIDEIKDDRK